MFLGLRNRVRAWRRSRTRAAAETREAEAWDTSIQGALNDGDLRMGQILRLAWWATIDDPVSAPRREIGAKYAVQAQETFIRRNPGSRIGVFARAGGVQLEPDGTFTVTWLKPAITFDYSEAGALIGRIDAVAEQAQELFAHSQRRWFRRRRRRECRQPQPEAETKRDPKTLKIHSERAYGLASLVLTAVDVESATHEANGAGELPSPTARFRNEMAMLSAPVARAERLLRDAAQASAQSTYMRGMAVGAVVLLALSGALGAIFYGLHWKAEYGIGVPAGGLGAVVSVLQRITAKTLKLDVGAGRSQLRWLGAIRPLIGAIFGMVLIGLLQAKLFNVAVPSDGSRLALYGALAFFFGFNERFAQDALAAAAMPVGRGGSAEAARAPDDHDPVRTTAD